MLTQRGKATQGHSEKVAVYKPKRRVPGEPQPANTLIVDVQPPEL